MAVFAKSAGDPNICSKIEHLFETLVRMGLSEISQLIVTISLSGSGGGLHLYRGILKGRATPPAITGRYKK